MLRELGHLLCGEVRAECWLGRRDGGTFVLVLPETDRTGARVLAERLRTRVEAHAFRCARDVGPVTVSIGLGALDESIDSTPQFYQRAEAHLAEAKRAGRNRVGTGSVEGSAS